MKQSNLKTGIGIFAFVLFTSVILSGCLAKTEPATIVEEDTMAPAENKMAPAEKKTAPVTANQITIQNMGFAPATLTVKAGSTVSVTNKDLVGHSVTSDDGSSFDTDIVSKDKTVTFTAPTTPGTYKYHCTPHPMMKGTLIVE